MKQSLTLKKKHIKWILILLVLSIGIFFIWPTPLTETGIFVPVTLINIPDGLVISPPFPKGIDVQVSGPKSTIQALKDRTLQYELDLSDKQIGNLTFPINKDHISLPPDVTIKKIKPSFLTVSIEKESIKIVPVHIALLGKPSAGHIISEMTVTPASVTLKGPKSQLDPIKEVHTKPVDINGAFESFKKETTLDLAQGIQSTIGSESVLVELTIQEKVAIREFENIPVKGINTKYTYHISPTEIEIKIKGPINELDALDANKTINVHIDLNGLQPGIYMKPAVILLPVNIVLIQVEPEIFTVKIDNESAPPR